ncbi:hypothetical protein [Staphylococcus coagulans]|uniref:hypothetical protein n=1 Tax=Staphylococcus coagulans TaxID=74706 RepID=UPI0015F84C86|nr:hypothetical protein [Staphylococcus coagulans]MBA8764665.1 hypothetical protein [Staphylococcus coagulans]MBT2810121.1 hypothetical protein [Staphylococcus coagulans]MBT2821698.1 hypothetical protein [Staphylococcus coagulans]MBT2830797.1 hypothetical protein [Staphylococcus coagulans]MBT2840003.1 hypothetical protein [Staphylococcus coagulans]
MDKNYILKLLRKQELDHIELTLITGNKVSVYKIEEDNSENELIEVLEPTKITVNLKYVVTIEEIYPPDFEALNELSF